MWTPCPFPVSLGMTSQRSCPRPGPPANWPEEDSNQGLSPSCLPHRSPHSLPYNAALHLPWPFPRSPHVGVLLFVLLFAPTCFPKSQARLPRTMLTDTQRAGWRWARGAITFRLYLLAPGLPCPSPPLPDQPWLLSRTRGSLSHERHHSVPPRLGAASPPGL